MKRILVSLGDCGVIVMLPNTRRTYLSVNLYQTWWGDLSSIAKREVPLLKLKLKWYDSRPYKTDGGHRAVNATVVSFICCLVGFHFELNIDNPKRWDRVRQKEVAA